MTSDAHVKAVEQNKKDIATIYDIDPNSIAYPSEPFPMSPKSDSLSWAQKIFSDPGVYYHTSSGAGNFGGRVSRDPPPVPESLCGNCRRDWHDAPLTEDVARMWEGCAFSEDYDPAADVSRIVCPGSECYGPPVMTKPQRNEYSYGESFPIGPSWQEIMTAGIPSPKFSLFDKFFKKLEWPTLDVSSWMAPWSFEPEPSPIESLQKTLTDMENILTGLGLPPADEETCQQAAIAAAPKAIEMAHQIPQPPGFDFSGWNGKPALYTYMKGKKKI